MFGRAKIYFLSQKSQQSVQCTLYFDIIINKNYPLPKIKPFKNKVIRNEKIIWFEPIDKNEMCQLFSFLLSS